MNNNKGMPKDTDSDWNTYRLYVLDYIKKLVTSIEDCEKKIGNIQLENVTKIYETKEEFQAQLQELATTVLKLQIRVGLILTGLTVIITLLFNVVSKYLLAYIEK
jgi:predicted PurR-regulated permease PerM